MRREGDSWGTIRYPKIYPSVDLAVSQPFFLDSACFEAGLDSCPAGRAVWFASPQLHDQKSITL